LPYKFFGRFRILERIGALAYKLALPAHSRVHPVFHVSQLKKCLGPGQQVQSPHPPPDISFQIPLQVLQRRVRQKGLRRVVQGLIKWSDATGDTVTWEDLEALQQQFPAAPAWGQAGFQEEGIVSDPGRKEALKRYQAQLSPGPTGQEESPSGLRITIGPESAM
jgi:hypothetical protein